MIENFFHWKCEKCNKEGVASYLPYACSSNFKDELRFAHAIKNGVCCSRKFLVRWISEQEAMTMKQKGK